MQAEDIFPHEVFSLFGIPVRDTVIVTWAIIIVVGIACALVTRRLRDNPKGLQNLLESLAEQLHKLASSLTTQPAYLFFPILGALAVFLLISNFVAIIPGVSPPTRDINTTSALALIVFSSVHVYGFILKGFRKHLKTYLEPSWILLPFNIIGEITRTISLSLRLFGNMVSGELIVVIAAVLAGLLVPVPLQIFGLLIGIIQAYVFTLLAMVYIAAGVEAGTTNRVQPRK